MRPSALFVALVAGVVFLAVTAEAQFPRRGPPRPHDAHSDGRRGPADDPMFARRQSWKHLVGMHKDEAVEHIRTEHPELKVVALPEGSMMTMDYNPQRVRVFHDPSGRVTQAPRTG